MPGMPPTRFAFLGPEGTFSEAALRALPAAAHGIGLPQPSVTAAIDSVRSGEADAAVVPLENSVEGSVPSTLDELANGADPLVIVREIVLPVTFCLAARSDLPLEQVKTVAAHPHAEAQCRGWLRATLPQARVELSGSNAAAALSVSEGAYDAAVTGPLAAERYRLVPLAADVADKRGAFTRFVLVARPGRPAEPTGRDKTSLVAFIRHNHTGALLEVLTEFGTRGVNLTRIESRPTKVELGEYCFFLDCEGHVAEARVGEALSALHRICSNVRYLGSYPRTGGEPRPLPPGRSDADFADARAWLARLRDGAAE